jgi:hypothetical protein
MLTATPCVKSEGSIVTTAPDTVTLADVTSIVCVMLPCSLTRMFPVPFAISLSKVIDIPDVVETFTASSSGEKDVTSGAVTSPLFRNTDMKANCAETTRSLLPSPSISAIAATLGFCAVANVTPVAKLIALVPAFVLRNTDTD